MKSRIASSRTVGTHTPNVTGSLTPIARLYWISDRWPIERGYPGCERYAALALPALAERRGVVDEGLPICHGAMTGNHGTDARGLSGASHRRWIGGGTAAVPLNGIHSGKGIAGVHDAEPAKHDEGVVVGVSRAEVVQVDRVGAGEQRQRVLERAIGQPVLPFRRAEFLHARHARRGVLLHDHLDVAAEEGIAADMVVMMVRVENMRHRLVGDGAQHVEQSLSGAQTLGVDEHHTAVTDEDRGVA